MAFETLSFTVDVILEAACEVVSDITLVAKFAAFVDFDMDCCIASLLLVATVLESGNDLKGKREDNSCFIRSLLLLAALLIESCTIFFVLLILSMAEVFTICPRLCIDERACDMYWYDSFVIRSLLDRAADDMESLSDCSVF